MFSLFTRSQCGKSHTRILEAPNYVGDKAKMEQFHFKLLAGLVSGKASRSSIGSQILGKKADFWDS